MNTTLTISVPAEKNYHQSLLLCSCYRPVMLLDSTNDTSSSIWLFANYFLLKCPPFPLGRGRQIDQPPGHCVSTRDNTACT